MANYRQRLRSYGRRAYNGARTIVRYVKRRTRRPRKVSFIKKNKNLLIVLALLAGVYFFKDKLTAMLTKKP